MLFWKLFFLKVVLTAGFNAASLQNLPNEIFSMMQMYLDPIYSNRLYQTSRVVREKFFQTDSPHVKLVRQNRSKFINSILQIQNQKEIAAKIDKKYWEDEICKLIETRLITPEMNVLTAASFHGHEKVVRLFLESVDAELETEAFLSACSNGQLKVVQLMLGKIVIGEDLMAVAASDALQSVHLNVFQLITNPHAVIPKGNLEIVRSLSLSFEYRLRLFEAACLFGKADIVEVMLNDKMIKFDSSEIDRYEFSVHYLILQLISIGHFEIAISITNHVFQKKVKVVTLSDVVDVFLSSESEDELFYSSIYISACSITMDAVYKLANVKEEAETIQLQLVQRLLEDERVIPDLDDSEALQCVSKNGNFKLVELLLGYNLSASADNDFPIRSAAHNGHLEVVKLLLKQGDVDPAAANNEAIVMASMRGHSEIVKLLLSREDVDPTAQQNMAIRLAAEAGNSKVVQLLLTVPNVDPSAHNNEALEQASLNGHFEIVELLLKNKQVQSSCNYDTAIQNAWINGFQRIVDVLMKTQRQQQSH